jgi:hypothetical protein
MTALAGARNTPHLGAGEVVLTSHDVALKAGTKAYKGGVLCTDSTGYGVKATATTGLICCGILDPQQAAQPNLDNTSGSSGDIIARVTPGNHRLGNSLSTDAITVADVGAVCYLVDDQTVAKTDGGGARSPAGIIEAVDSSGVFVFMARWLSRLLATPGVATGSAPAQVGLASGAISVTTRTTTLAVTGTVAYTLANGTFLGQRKTIIADSAGGTPHGVLTPTLAVGWTSADFTTARGSLELEWTTLGWRIVNTGGTVAIT